MDIIIRKNHSAAQTGFLGPVKHLKKTNEFDAIIVQVEAVLQQNIAILSWMFKNNDLNIHIWEIAVKNNKTAVLIWLMSVEFEKHEIAIEAALCRADYAMADWLANNGFPIGRDLVDKFSQKNCYRRPNADGALKWLEQFS